MTVSILGACKKKEDPAPNPGTGSTNCSGTMTVKMDGKAYTAADYNNTLILSEVQDYGVHRMDIRTTVNGGTLVLSFTNWEWQNPAAEGIVAKKYENDVSKASCKTINGDELCDEMLGTFIKGNETYSSGMAETMGSITVTKIDATKKTVSGTYDFPVVNFDDDTIMVSGTFTDQCYLVIK